MRVYHGGYTAVEMPKIFKSKFPKDFGEGFYCSELEEQAARWASRYDIAVVSIMNICLMKILSNMQKIR